MGKYMIIDGNRVEFDKEKNILDLVRNRSSDILLLFRIINLWCMQNVCS